MAILPSTVFQPPLPPLILLIPPSSSLQWILRLILLTWTLSTIPLILTLVPLSLILPEQISILPIHPHNRPSHIGLGRAYLRGVGVYLIGGLVWAVTSTGGAPENGESVLRVVSGWVRVWVEWAGWWAGEEDSDDDEMVSVIDDCAVCTRRTLGDRGDGDFVDMTTGEKCLSAMIAKPNIDTRKTTGTKIRGRTAHKGIVTTATAPEHYEPQLPYRERQTCSKQSLASPAIVNKRGMLSCEDMKHDQVGAVGDSGPVYSALPLYSGKRRRRAKPKLVLGEEEMDAFPVSLCRGILAEEGLDRRQITGFWLNHEREHGGGSEYEEKQQLHRDGLQEESSTPEFWEQEWDRLDETQGSRYSATTSPPRSPLPRRAFLFLAGGGYVTGYPLVHPFIFSLLRSLPSEPTSHYPSPDSSTNPSKSKSGKTTPPLPRYAVLAPHVRKSLSLDRAFPIPLLDALAGYYHLRKIGYEAQEIVVVGDSAGGGLAWSLVAYLAALDEEDRYEDSDEYEDRNTKGEVEMGVPGGLAMISPWISLPPTTSSSYPDLIDEPQLLNAARCYLARFPILKHRPDPFRSDFYLWAEMAFRRINGVAEGVMRLMPLPLPLSFGPPPSLRRKSFTRRRRHTKAKTTTEGIEQTLLHPNFHFAQPKAHLGWLENPIFNHLTSHHPLVSPASDPSSPFVQHTFELLVKSHGRALKIHGEFADTNSSDPRQVNRQSRKKAGTKLFIHAGSAEWFYRPTMDFADSARKAGMQVVIKTELGGFHIEGCLIPAEFGGAGGRLVEDLREWVLS